MSLAATDSSNTIIPVILAGGSGTRLWPLSRELYPKQLLPLVDGNTMLQNTVMRFSGLPGVGDPLVICNANHRFEVAEQLRTIGVRAAAIVLEPCGRNTAPAAVTAALAALSIDPDPVLLIAPADHHIERVDAFRDAIGKGAPLARAGNLITFGILPNAPEIGYGYIQKGGKISLNGSDADAFRIARFVEKPDRQTAEEYLASGDYAWNSGIFMFRASTLIEEMNEFAPEIVEACRKAYANGKGDLDFYRLDADEFEACPSDSIDYAVMEKTGRGAVIALDAGWNDLGSWGAIWDIKEKDANGNVTIGDVFCHDVERSYLHSTSRLVTAIGLRECIVVETVDAVLVAPWDKLQEVKPLVQKLKDASREEAISHRKVFRPWGSYESINSGNRFRVKRLTVKPGARLSLQKHHHRAEHWVVVHGTALVTRGNEEFLLKEDESTYIPLGVCHRLENPGKIPLELIEVQSGSYLGEDDIVRFDDTYGRECAVQPGER